MKDHFQTELYIPPAAALSLRYYQTDAEDQVLACFSNDIRRLILCSPTGSGKTVTFADIALKSVQRGKRVMILCDRKELIGQAKNKLNSLGLFPTIVAPGHRMTINLVYLASVDTLRRRDFPEVDLLIIDEAHKQSFDNVILKYIEFCNPYVIGATATPLRTGNQNCLTTIYQEIVDVIDIPELIGAGYLSPARTFAARNEEMDKMEKKGNEFDAKALFATFNRAIMYDGLVENYFKFSENRKAICFNPDVTISRTATDKFREAGIISAHVDGKTPDSQRAQILKDFSNGRIQVLNNCGVLTTGYDEPSIETVIVNRATLSLPLWLQMAGRGSRILDGKENFHIIDQGGNVWRHGLWEQKRTWNLKKKPKREGDGVAPVKLCEGCGSINPAPARVCSHCGRTFEVEEKKLHKAEFIEVKTNVLIRGMQKRFEPLTATEAELKAHAEAKGYKSGWVYKQLELQAKRR